MRRFAELLTQLDNTTRSGAKVEAMAGYFRTAPAEDAAWAAYLLSGQRHRRVLTSRGLRAACVRVTGLPEWLVEQAYAHVGDGAETVTLLLRAERRAGQLSAAASRAAPLELPLHVWLNDLVPSLRGADEAETAERLRGWWASVPEAQLYVLNKAIAGGFRIGVGKRRVEQALARASGLPRERITHRMIGDLEPTPDAFRALLRADDGAPPPSRPYPFLLAHPLTSPDELAGGLDAWRAEIKLDGIRGQLIRRAGETHLWSRGEERITPLFPELDAAAEALPDGTVLDGEITAWGDDGPRAFGDLQPRLGRKRVPDSLLRRAPLRFVAYDLLEADGEDLRGRSLDARRARLAALLAPALHDAAVATPSWPGLDAPALLLSPRLRFATFEDLRELRDGARAVGGEGLMLKRGDAAYGVGRRRGPWWKFKAEPFRLDAVLVYAQAGSGRRSGLFTDLTLALWDEGELVTFAKAYSGLSDAEFARLSRWIRRNATERFGPVRGVPPVQVFELAFEGIWPNPRKKSGLGVRFPRIVRWREDKPAHEADALDTARALLRSLP